MIYWLLLSLLPEGLLVLGNSESPLEVVFSWQKSVKLEVTEKGQNVTVDGGGVPIGIKVFDDSVYLTLPRWKPGVAVNLAVTAKPVNS